MERTQKSKSKKMLHAIYLLSCLYTDKEIIGIMIFSNSSLRWIFTFYLIYWSIVTAGLTPAMYAHHWAIKACSSTGTPSLAFRFTPTWSSSFGAGDKKVVTGTFSLNLKQILSNEMNHATIFIKKNIAYLQLCSQWHLWAEAWPIQSLQLQLSWQEYEYISCFGVRPS